MSPSFPPEIYHYILSSLVNDLALGDDLEERVSPFNLDLRDYAPGRSALATCSLASKGLYDISTPLLWRHLVVQKPGDLRLLCHLSMSGLTRPTRRSVNEYTRRLDILWWRDEHLDLAKQLLASMRELHVLTLADHTAELVVWAVGPSDAFIEFIPTACPFLRRLHFLSPSVAPTLRQVAVLSVGCENLQTFQTIGLNRDQRHVQSPEQVFREVRSWEPDHFHSRWEFADDPPTEGVELWFGFRHLKTLAIGDGFDAVSTRQGVDVMVLLGMFWHQEDSVPQLRQLDLFVPFQKLRRVPMTLRGCVRSGVHHLVPSQKNRVCYGSFRNLTCLIFILEIGADIIFPAGLDVLNEVEVVTRSYRWGGFPGHPKLLEWNGQLAKRFDTLLDRLLARRSFFPLLNKVLLWRRIPGNRIVVDGVFKDFVLQFEQNGIKLELRDHRRTRVWASTTTSQIRPHFV